MAVGPAGIQLARLATAMTIQASAGASPDRAPRSGTATVSIVIPVFNRAELTQGCLEALAACTAGSFEVIVVDNGSTDSTGDLLRRFEPVIQVLHMGENLGFARACNAGAARARGKYVVFLNNDTLPRAGWLAAMVAAAETDPQVGVVGSRLLYPDGTIQHAGLGFSADFEPIHLHQGVPGDSPAVSADRDCEAVTGACLLLSRAFFLELGGFDEGYRMYFEDVDLCLRARAAGRRVRYAATSVLVHLERGSSSSFGAAYKLNRESRERFRARWLPAVPAAHATPTASAGPPAPAAPAAPAASAAPATALAVRASPAAPSVLFQARAGIFSQPGGDTVVVQSLMRWLERCGARVRFSAEPGVPAGTDVVHTINLATPEATRAFAEGADRARVPLVVTTLYEDWARFLDRANAAHLVFRQLIGSAPGKRAAGFDRARFQEVFAGLAAARSGTATSGSAPANRITAGIARVLIACGESERRRLETDFPMARDVRVVPFGSDLHAGEVAVPADGAFQAAHGVSDFILCVGRLEQRKNQLMLLEALRDDPRPVVLAGGGFSYQPEYVRLVRALERRGPTLILDRLSSAELTAAYREAAVHCLASWYELPGLVSLEAARHGTRVAASRWGAIEDYLGDGAAYLEPDDPESIRRAIELALHIDPAVAAERARSFTWERAARELLAVYEEIASPARHKAAGARLDAAGADLAAQPARPAAPRAAGDASAPLLTRNRETLERCAPGLLVRVAAAEMPSSHRLTTAPGGEPLLCIDGTPLQHMSDPARDARRWARDAVDRLERVAATRVVVVGIGLAYHLEALAELFSGTIVVVEPDLAVWRTLLTTRDVSRLLERVQIGDDAPANGSAERTYVLGYAPALLLPGGAYRSVLEHWQGSAAQSGLRLKILVVSPVYGGSWPIAGHAARALAQLGHDVELLDLGPFHDPLRALERFGARRGRHAQLESQLCDVLGAGVAAAVEAKQPDIVLALAQAPLGVAALEQIGRAGALRVLWFVEDFRRFTYWRAVASQYDYLFTIQDGECLDAVGAATDGRVGYLPCAFDPEMHRPIALDAAEHAAYGSDISFVGAGYRNRRIALRSFLDCDFRIWGSDWAGQSALERVLQRDGARIDTEEAVRIFNATKVNLNLHSSTYHDGIDPRGDFVNPRTFELAGAGAFQVVDARTLLPALFAPGHELAVATTVAEMRELALHYLAHADERAQMAARSRERALAEHTYGRRMQALLGAIVGREQDRLLGRPRGKTVGDVARRGGGKLERFLGQLDPTTPLSLDRIVASIPERKGPLEDAEAILLFLHQFDDLYLTEYRA
jgi:spore maturation protein CgeB